MRTLSKYKQTARGEGKREKTSRDCFRFASDWLRIKRFYRTRSKPEPLQSWLAFDLHFRVAQTIGA